MAADPALQANATQATVADPHHIQGAQRPVTLANEQVKDVKEHGTWSNVSKHDHTTLYVDKKREDLHDKDDIHKRHLERDAHVAHDDHNRLAANRDAKPLHYEQAGLGKSNPPAI